MTQDNLLTYPYVRKEEFEATQLENQRLREQIDVMYAEFNQLKGFLDMGMLDINTLIEYSIGKKTKATDEEVKKIEQRLKDISSIDKVSKLTSDNIKYKVELNDKDKIITLLKNDVDLLKQELKRIVDEQNLNKERDKQTIFTLRNLDDNMNQKLKDNEKLEFRYNELKKLNEDLQKDLTKKALKLGYVKSLQGFNSGEQKPMIAYSPQEDRIINRKLRKVKKLIKAKWFKQKKMEKAQQILFDVKQSIALMQDNKDKQFLNDEIKKFDEVLNVN